MTLQRSKSVSSQVDSAFVRVSNSEADYNQAKYVRVPDPGGETEVSLEVPEATGYRAGVLAVESDGAAFDNELPYSYGFTESTFEVNAGETTQVSPTFNSAQPTIEIPDGVGVFEKDTVRVETEIYLLASATRGTSAGFDFRSGVGLDKVYLDNTSSTQVEGFEISGDSEVSKWYVKVGVDYTARTFSEGTDGQLGMAYYPNPGNGPDGSGAYEIPVNSNSGTVVITFDKNGNKTRRLVK